MDQDKPRGLGTDGFNSVAHGVFGYLANTYSIIYPLFISYQLLSKDENTVVDLSEFFIGNVLGRAEFGVL